MEDLIVLINDRFGHRKKPENSKKHSPSLILLTQCMENLSLCNLKIFLCISIKKREASEHSEVSAFGLDLKKNLGIHFFNLDTQENFQITLGQIVQTLC